MMNRAENDLLRVATEYVERTDAELRWQRRLNDLLAVAAFVAIVALLFVALHLDVIK
jgi:hypothetical protein